MNTCGGALTLTGPSGPSTVTSNRLASGMASTWLPYASASSTYTSDGRPSCQQTKKTADPGAERSELASSCQVSQRPGEEWCQASSAQR